MTQLGLYIVSDVHGYIFPTDFSHANQQLPMGLLYANQLIESSSKHDDIHFKIDNGDFLQGAPFCNYLVSKLQTSEPLTTIYNRLNFDFGTIGNHEFNYGLTYLNDTLQTLNYPVLCANILDSQHQPFTGEGVHYFEKGDLIVGVIGLTTQYIPNWEQPHHIEGLTFKSAVETLAQVLPNVRNKADIVVVSYHGGFECDVDTDVPTEDLTGENEASEILRRFHKSIDVLITGHQHRDIATVKYDSAVIQPGTRATQIGKVTLTIGDNNQIIDTQSELLPVVRDSEFSLLPEDAKLLTQLEDWLDTEITTLPEPMLVEDKFKARMKPHPLINLINGMLLENSGADIASTALFDSAAGFNTRITMREIINNYPFPNTFQVLKLTGAGIKDALEKSASYFALNDENEITINDAFLYPKPQHFNYDMYGGITYTIHVGEPIGQRVTDIKVGNEPLISDKTYTICVNNYRAVGGGNYNMFANAPVVKDIQEEGAQLLIDFITNNDLSNIPQVVNFKVQQ
ncbi:bifunctional metallophosphatase/5'-nucleotidase [Staphylococcus borealis]|uniref:bifunctional metallophosphatase/5'-nucleotidase n=1 Tax=Staphylococcus borealis TaxID=2742203 RepID=UPI002DBC7E49|nr:bifunctional UDP-sugar hydrolase/5'-nucleotidase [Staphylococcus borealis]MEB7366903.1 bifunctional metallophosphatase/5'-nucleotidase [Staphylococcus borealis]MEB7460382.1 bifunctional metallophosphatase/5'-nucleotidase [Staphylococcus borealis]